MKTYSTKAIAAFYFREIRRYPRKLAGLAIFLPLTILVNNFLPPLILATVLSRLSQHHYTGSDIWANFGAALLLYAVFEFFGGFIWRAVDYFVWTLEGNVQRNLAQRVFQAMTEQTSDFHANNFGGSLVSQTTKLLSSYVRIADTTWFQTSQVVFGLLFTVIILLPRAPWFVLVLLLLAIIFIVVAFRASRPVMRRSSLLSQSESKQTGYLADAITNVMMIKSFARGTHERANFAALTDTSYERLTSMMRSQRRQLNIFDMVTGVMTTSSLLFAIISVVKFNANIATVFLIFNYTNYMINQLFSFSNNSLRNYNRAFGDAADMVAILAEKPSVTDPPKPEKVRIQRGKIEFSDVAFKHIGASDAIFDGLNLRIKPGEKIGLVGHSGSGKTTFTRLLLRFSDIDGGEIRIDGQNIAKIMQDDLHKHIAYVPQEPLLFHRSIAENISYGAPGGSVKAIEAVAKLAHAHEFIRLLPQGYDTLVGERGVKLSGGQRQRIAIARAMLKNAPILLLDEATSALDSESEVLIQEALWRLMEGKTAIVIAHRLSTIQHMDRIIVLDDGKIVEQGGHAELLKANGTYAKLWAHQSGGFLEE